MDRIKASVAQSSEKTLVMSTQQRRVSLICHVPTGRRFPVADDSHSTVMLADDGRKSRWLFNHDGTILAVDAQQQKLISIVSFLIQSRFFVFPSNFLCHIQFHTRVHGVVCTMMITKQRKEKKNKERISHPG